MGVCDEFALQTLTCVLFLEPTLKGWEGRHMPDPSTGEADRGSSGAHVPGSLTHNEMFSL